MLKRFAALALRSATTNVEVYSATQPSSGQVLTATSSTAATWQTPTVSSKESIGFTADGGGAVITTGKIKGYFTCPYAANITAWNIVVDTGTVTVKVWKIATGTAKPTASNSINSSGLQLSSGTAIHDTTLTDFTTTAVAANDIFAFNIETISGVMEMSFGLELTRI